MYLFFSFLYEDILGLFDQDAYAIFELYSDESVYTILGLLLIMTPLLLWGMFYFVWKFPYGSLVHWLIWLIITAILVAIVTWLILNSYETRLDASGALSDLEAQGIDFKAYLSFLYLKFACINAALSTVLSTVYSLVMKQSSKVQAHLPI